ncbi:hypothetical protein QTP70_002076 [Hemibagrus guttatus]|uniref:Uncharacterized protein n=1 Tax=Hemibagrus guttatus TaxID=175788 RepID=A0AAE0V9N8_9TELE|nr:hypothetical protein QTP70_002076 [Hemibagrus guttatus]
MEFSPGEMEEAERRYIYPLKAYCALWFWLWLRDGCGSGFRFLRARHPYSSIRLIKVRGVWVQVSVNMKENTLAGHSCFCPYHLIM